MCSNNILVCVVLKDVALGGEIEVERLYSRLTVHLYSPIIDPSCRFTTSILISTEVKIKFIFERDLPLEIPQPYRYFNNK